MLLTRSLCFGVCDPRCSPSPGYGSVVLVEKRRGRDHGSRYALKISSLSRAALVERDILPRLRGLPYTTDLAYAFYTASPPRAFLALREYEYTPPSLPPRRAPSWLSVSTRLPRCLPAARHPRPP